MFDKISHSINVIVRHNAFPGILVSFVIVLVAVILTKIVAVSLYHLQKKIITELKKAGISGASAIETKITVIRRIVETGIYLFAFFYFSPAISGNASCRDGLFSFRRYSRNNYRYGSSKYSF